MKLEELIAREKESLNDLIRDRNQAAGELEELRNQEAPDPARVGKLRADMGFLDSKIADQRSKIATIEREAEDDERLTREAQRSVAVTTTRAEAGLDRADQWVNPSTGERAALRSGESFRAHPVVERFAEQRVGADQAALAQYGGLGQMVRAMTTSGGSAIVPTVWAGSIIDKAREQSAITRAGATIVPMDAKTVKIGRLTGDPTADFRTEGSSITPSDPGLDNVTLDAKTMSTLVIGSMEWFQDADNADNIVEQAIAKAFAEELDLIGLYGGVGSGAGSIDLDAAKYPTGVLAELLAVSGAPNVLGASSGTTATNGTSITAASAYNEILDTIFTVRDGNEEPNALIWSSKMARKLAKLYDSTYQPLRAPQDVADMQRIVTTKIPSYTQGTLTTATDVFAGDWSQLLIGQRLEITIQVLTERYADSGQIGIVAHWRGDFALARPSAFAVFKALQGA